MTIESRSHGGEAKFGASLEFPSMYLAFGVVILAATVLLFSWGFQQHRRARPARWTKSNFLSSTFTILLVSMVPASIGSLIMAVSDPATVIATLSIPAAVAMVAFPVLALVYSPRLIREGLAGTADIVEFPVRPGGTPMPPVKKAA